jgi:hypothetical protein
MQRGDPLDNSILKIDTMTTVLLTRFGDERTITIPTQADFQGFLKAIRAVEPDRRWQIAESWEVV